MNNKAEHKFPFIYFWIILILIYVILFEFIFPSNKILPRPSILLDSLNPLQKDYHIYFNFLYSFSGIYLTIIVGYFIFILFPVYLLGLLDKFSGIIKFLASFRYFPLLGVIAIFILWFPYSFISEYIFYLAITFTFLISALEKGKANVKQEYIDSIISIAGNKRKIINEIIFKYCQPEIFYSIRELHIFLWSVMLVFEFVKAQSGLGSLFRSALLYNDLSILFLLSVIIFIIIAIGDYIIRLIHKKSFHWES